MAKRKSLSFDSEELTKDLKESAGKGMDAFFSPTPPASPSVGTKNNPETTESRSGSPANAKLRKKKVKERRLPTNNIASMQSTKQASNIAILQFDDADIEHLRESAYKAQTYRFSEREVEWIKDIAHSLSKELRRGKVAQVDILRVAIKLLENALATSKADLIDIFGRMK